MDRQSVERHGQAAAGGSVPRREPDYGRLWRGKAALNRLTNALAAEVFTDSVCINTVEPRSGVRTEGAKVLLPDGLAEHQLETLKEMVEASVALCDGPPELTDQVTVGLDPLASLRVPVRSLDGKEMAANSKVTTDDGRR
jgi:NAD(P)-dependent dehydrogenase (short-subunit alcohol dehydrogenase family)